MKKQQQWTELWKTWVRATPVPGIWQRMQGGHLVRARVVDPTTGRLKEIKKVLPEADLATAHAWLANERRRIQSGRATAMPDATRFREFAEALLEQKVQSGDIKSPKGRDKWQRTLEHLSEGTSGPKTSRHVAGFGDFFIDKLHVTHVEAWRTGIAGLIRSGDYSPNTANGWLAILRVIAKAAKRTYGLPEPATEGVKDFDTSEHETYPEEEPNSLLVDEARVFLAALRQMYPQHYAMTYLGFATGLRPSSLRPLRRTGPNADVQWDRNRLLVRRSQTVGDEVMKTTKQKRRYAIELPEEVMDVLRWHVETQLLTPEQQESELLFPSILGGYRSPSVLNKPFADVAEAIGLGKRFTQRGMRRTFNDLARAAQVEGLVTRSISGHLTEQMQHHYSTVAPEEQRAGIAKVLRLVRHDEGSTDGAPNGAPPAASTA
jgi:integrase